MRLLSLLLILAASLATPLVVAAADVYVIANPSVDLQAGDLRDVYLGEKLFSGSVRLRPVDNAGAQDAFLSDVMHMTGTAYASAWTKKAFRQGLTQPPMYSGDAEVIDFVRRNEGAVGYARSAPSGVKVLQKLAK